MTKVITFSRQFPGYHPRKGEPTQFIQKIWKSLGGVPSAYTLPFTEGDFKKSIVWGYQMVDGCKYHTIRSGHRWKVGDMFSPVVWGNDINHKSGRSGPYQSKQIKIAPDIEIKKVWDFEIKDSEDGILWLDGEAITIDKVELIAKNDGLSLRDLLDWFKYPKDFSGQIICWNENIKY
jgi:hypothetical protein